MPEAKAGRVKALHDELTAMQSTVVSTADGQEIVGVMTAPSERRSMW
jgi:hypothetical protein